MTHPIPTAEGPLGRLDLARRLRDIAREAGHVIMPYFNQDTDVRTKEDGSAVTDADEAAERLILERLEALAPYIPVVAEEAMAAGQAPEVDEGPFFLVDPLDGTKEFISGRGEFTVNIALVDGGAPIIGVVYAPALSRMFFGAVGEGAFEEKIAPDGTVEMTERAITTRTPPEQGLTAVASRSHRDEKTDDYLAKFKVASFVSAGSSLKFCLVAAGEADIYPRHGRTMEWDTAAGHAVLTAAGGTVTEVDGPVLRYGKVKDAFANPFFVARGSGS